MNTVIAFVVIFGALVFFHELGHLIFAKRAGMLCREFAIGFGPKVFSFTKNETNYTIRLLPLGGFVRVAGEDPELIEIKPGYNIGLTFKDNGKVDRLIINNKSKFQNAKVIEVERADIDRQLVITGYEQEDEETLKTYQIDEKAKYVMDGKEIQIAPYDRTFASKTLSQRFMHIFAGPLFNFILAYFIFLALGFLQGSPINEPLLGKLTPDGSAIEAGLEQGDRVVSIDNEKMNTWTDVVEIIKTHPNEELLFTINRQGNTLQIPVTPDLREIGEEQLGIIGVYAPVEKSFVGSVTHGFTETFRWTKEIFLGLGKLITGQFSIDMLSGPVGIYSLTDQVAESGIYNLMRWGAILSINLGIINLLPLPALDGGRLMFLGVEALRGKPIDSQKEGMVHFIGFALLMLLMIVVTWNDIQKFFL